MAKSNTVDINESDRSQIVNGLHVAAERFREHVAGLQADVNAGSFAYKGLAEQFQLQADECSRLATLIQECDSMRLETINRCQYCGEEAGNDALWLTRHLNTCKEQENQTI